MPGTTTTTTLLLIDVQKDFHPGGSLAIPAADADAERIAALIRQNARSIDRIVATLDTHLKLHVAHPGFWWKNNDTTTSVASSSATTTEPQQQQQQHRHPDPFTIISADDIRQGVWRPRADLQLPVGSWDAGVFYRDTNTNNNSNIKMDAFDLTQYCIEYATRLEAAGRFQICIWPEHCILGSTGHGLVDSVRRAVDEWSATTGRSVEWVLKGQNILTEMYSALRAEVPVTHDTAFHTALQTSLLASDRLLVCGQALSHCVNYTVRDIVEHWPANETAKICLLQDCASPVPGFEPAAATFVRDMKQVGVRLRKSTDSDLF